MSTTPRHRDPLVATARQLRVAEARRERLPSRRRADRRRDRGGDVLAIVPTRHPHIDLDGVVSSVFDIEQLVRADERGNATAETECCRSGSTAQNQCGASPSDGARATDAVSLAFKTARAPVVKRAHFASSRFSREPMISDMRVADIGKHRNVGSLAIATSFAMSSGWRAPISITNTSCSSFTTQPTATYSRRSRCSSSQASRAPARHSAP